MNLAPGVSIEEVNTLSLTVPVGATAVPVFIGVFRDKQGERVDNADCIRVENWLDFSARFGASSSSVASVALTSATSKKEKGKQQEQPAPEDELLTPSGVIAVSFFHTTYLGSLSVKHYFENGGGPCYLLPIHSLGDVTERQAMSAKIARHPEISILCLCELTYIHDMAMYAALDPLLSSPRGYFLIADSLDGQARPPTTETQTAVYTPLLETFYPSRPADQDIFVDFRYYDITSEDRDSGPRKTLAEVKAEDEGMYAQCRNQVEVFFLDKRPPKYITMRASPAVAGAYCRTDRERGVWKAPANVALYNVKALAPVKQQDTTAAGINAIRDVSDRGPVIMGARTMVSPATPNWLYIPVRRLFNAAQRDIQQAMRFAVFQPNSQPTWEAVRAAVNNYLHRLWRDGALIGESPEDAYFVQIGKEVTMTEADIQQGRMIIKIGMAAVRPAEFILLEFMQGVAGSGGGGGTGPKLREEMLKPQDALSGKDYGRAVCVSADGSVLAVGASDATVADMALAGAVYLYRFNGQHWVPWQTISAQEKKAGSKFGAALSLSADGRVLVVGAPQYGDAEAKTGAVYMFRRDANQWQEEEVTYGEEDGEKFGGSISLSADGSVLAVGASGATNGTANHGAIYLFRHTESEWCQEAKLTEDRYVGNLGRSVSLSADGTVLAAGAPSMIYENKGRVLVFHYNAAAWSTPGILISRPVSSPSYVDFGWSVSLTADGNTLAIGCRRDNAQGRVYLFDYKDGKWSYSNVMLEPNPLITHSYFSSSLSFSGDGLSLAVGALSNNAATSAAYLFKKEKDKWVERIKIEHTGPANAWLGESVSLSANGNVFAMAAVAANANTINGFVQVKSGLAK